VNPNFVYTTTLQYKVKSLSAKVAGFESGERYTRIKTEFNKRLRAKDCEIARLKNELTEARRETICVRKNWFETFDDITKEHVKEAQEKDLIIKAHAERILEVERQRDEAKDKLRDKLTELYDVKTELEEERGKNHKLQAQVERDFENSSIPSSMQTRRKKITNSREKTDRKPGAQPGHEWHGRRRLEPTKRCELPVPRRYANSPDYELTDEIRSRQKIGISVKVEVIEFFTKVYREIKTGKLFYADFPQGYDNDVNYDGSVKALLFLLCNECNVSHDKAISLLSEITEEDIKISKGMSSGLSEEFSSKTEKELKESVYTILSSPIMNVDFTNANVNGDSAQVLICAAPSTAAALFIAREHKGHEGVKGTPVEDYQGTMVHDHDKTFYNYGTNHQECMQHNCRYIKGSMENEVGLTWNTKMLDLTREMLHYRNGLGEEDDLDKNIVEDFEIRYDNILKIAKDEYEYEPPSKYYKDGYNLYLRLQEYKKYELLFLHDKRVPANNSLCERLARLYKRKQKQAMVMRSFTSLGYLCNSMSVLYTLRTNEKNIYEQVTEIFNRPRPPKSKTEIPA
jgi:hypothetical protein